MQRVPTILDTAALVADTSRLTMLLTLLDGRGHTATELAYAANISAQTASFHLKKLVNADFLRAVRQGRFRYFRLESEEIARWLESLLVLHHAPKPRRIRSSCPTALREARACYKHLAGRAGIRVYRALLAARLLVPHGTGLAVVPGAQTLLATLDITLDSKTITARPCLDWSEREFHLAGELGDYCSPR